MSAIDDYGFSFNYVDRGNTTDNTFHSLYDVLLSIMSYTDIDIYIIYIYIYIYIYIHIHIHG